MSILLLVISFSDIHCFYLASQLVLCIATVPSVRLVDGGGSNQGRVEVYFNNEWGTVCDDSWDDNDAEVVCRQLGLPIEGARAYGKAHFGQGLGNILLDEVQCTGSEIALSKCAHDGWERDNCSPHEDAGVFCSGNPYLLIHKYSS